MADISRRDLIKGAAVLGSAVAAGGVTACASSPTPNSSGAPALVRLPELVRLPALVRGSVVFPSDPRYDSVRLLWNARFDDVRPRAVVEVADAADVAAVVTFARDNELSVRVRNGGHSFAGHSTGDSIVIDTRRLTEVAIDGQATSARLGAGFTNLGAYEALWPVKKAIPGGTCPTVGIAGLTTGGGLGVFGREHGLTCDALTGIEIVTADGRVVQADEHQNADLLWAARGGGGGSFGIITSMTFELIPADMPFTHATYTFPWTSAADVVAAWQAWFPGAPRQTWSAVFFQTQDPTKHTEPLVVLEIVHAGEGSQLSGIAADLLAAIGVPATESTVETTAFLSEETDFYCKGFQHQECALADETAEGKIPRPAMYGASNVAKQPWSAAGLDVIVEWIEKRQRDKRLTPDAFDPGRTVGKLIFETADAAVRDLAPDATAFVHRDALFVMQYQARWQAQSPADVVEANLDWVAGMYEATAPHRSGSAYQNYIDPRLQDWEHAYYGANLDRLRAIKRRVDPDNFFRFPQSIPPA